MGELDKGNVVAAAITDVKVARRQIWERIEEAADTLRRMPDAERQALQRAEAGQQWPLMLHTAADHAAWEKVPMRRPRPSAAQISRMEEVMTDWLVALAKQDAKFVKAVWLFCGLRRGPGKVAAILGCDRKTAKVWRDNGLDRIHAHRSVTSPERVQLAHKIRQATHHPKRLAG